MDETLQDLETLSVKYSSKATPPAKLPDNTNLFRKPMERVKTNVMNIARESKNMTDFKEGIGVYTSYNPLTTSETLNDLMKAVRSVVDVYDKTYESSLTRGSVQQLTREAVHEQTLLHMTKLGEDTQSTIRNILERNIGQGNTPKDAVNEMVNEIETMTKTRAEVIARTETANARNEAKSLQAEENGEDYFIVISSDTCCEDCYDTYNGKVFNRSEDEDILPPLHPNCVCEAEFFKRESMAERMADEVGLSSEEREEAFDKANPAT